MYGAFQERLAEVADGAENADDDGIQHPLPQGENAGDPEEDRSASDGENQSADSAFPRLFRTDGFAHPSPSDSRTGEVGEGVVCPYRTEKR